MSPARRRLAVLALRERLGMSERRACRLAGQHRSTQRHQAAVAGDDAALRARLREISRETEARVLIEDWRIDYNTHRPHSALGMLAPAAFAASLRQPTHLPTATASGERGEQRFRLPVATGAPQPAIFPAGQQQSPAEEITTTVQHTNRHLTYGGATITSTQLSQPVDR